MSELIKKEDGVAVFNVEIEPELFEESVVEAYKRSKGQFNIPGFRRGKAPRKIIENNYGKEIFHEDATNIALNKLYGPALDELGLQAVDYPKVDIKGEITPDKAFTAEFTVELRPEPVLGDYKNLEAEVVKMEVTEDRLNQEIDKERDKNSRMVAVEEGEAALGDTVNIDFEGFLGEEAFEGGQAEGYDLVLGSGSFVPGFEDQIVGKKIGEEFDVNVTFPEKYQEDLAGKDATFKVKLNSIQRKELPELDDDFAMDVSEFDTLEEYKNDLRKKLEENMEKAFKNVKIEKAVTALIDVMDVRIPEVMINDQLDREVEEFKHRVGQMGINLETYFAVTGSSEEKVREDLKDTAKRRVESELALEAFAKAEPYEVTEEDIDNELRELAKSYESQDVEKFVEDYKKEEENLDSLKYFIARRKNIDKLVDMVKFNVVEGKEEV